MPPATSKCAAGARRRSSICTRVRTEEVGERAIGILDLPRAAKIAGARLAVYRGLGARLEPNALAKPSSSTITRATATRNICRPSWSTRHRSPASVSCRNSLPTCSTSKAPTYGFLPRRRSSSPAFFATKLWTPTSCRSKFVPGRPAFAPAVAAAGRDTRGIIRQHQSAKWKCFQFTRPEQSYDEHEKLVRDAEALLQTLGLHCRWSWAFSAPAIWDLPPPRPTTSKSGCLRPGISKRSLPAPIARPSKPAAAAYAPKPKAARPNSCTRSTAPACRWAGHGSLSLRTINRPTAPS